MTFEAGAHAAARARDYRAGTISTELPKSSPATASGRNRSHPIVTLHHGFLANPGLIFDAVSSLFGAERNQRVHAHRPARG